MTSMDVPTQLRSRSTRPRRKEVKGGGIEVARFYTKAGVDVYDTCEWELRSAVITNERGDVVFEQRDVEMLPATPLRPLISSSVLMTPAIVPLSALPAEV